MRLLLPKDLLPATLRLRIIITPTSCDDSVHLSLRLEARAGSNVVPALSSRRCLEQFFQHLELSVANRVKAKMGRSRTLDAVSQNGPAAS